MNRIYNNPDYMVEDMTKGFLKAHKDLIAETEITLITAHSYGSAFFETPPHGICCHPVKQE